MADIFLSYSHKDSDLVESILAELRRQKLSIFQDKKGLGSGKAFPKQLQEQLEAAQCVLVCWSPAAAESAWVYSEAQAGLDDGKLASIVVAGPERFKPPMPFGQVHWDDMRLWGGPDQESIGWRKLLERIGDLCGRADLASWGKLEDADSATLENWLKKHAASPLAPQVTVALQRRIGLEQKEHIERERRARELAEGQRADAEALAVEIRKREEAEKAAREREDQVTRARIQLEETRKRAADERAAHSETERRVLEERIARENDAVREQERLAQLERERAQSLEKSTKALKDAIARKEKAEAENLRIAQLLAEANAKSSISRWQAEEGVDDYDERDYREPPQEPDWDWGAVAARAVGVAVAIILIVGIGTWSFAPARRAAVDLVQGLFPSPRSADASADSVEAHTPTSAMVAGADGVNLMSAPNESMVIARMAPGSALAIDGRVVWRETTWYRVALDDGRVGFVRATLVQTQGIAYEAYAGVFYAGPDGANIRTAPRVDAALVRRLEAGAEVRVNGIVAAQGWRWYRVPVQGGDAGFVREDVVQSARVSQVAARSPPQIVPYRSANRLTTGADGANVRSEPSTDGSVLIRLPAHQPLQVTGQTQIFDRTWYRVALSDGRAGYVRADVVQIAAVASAARPPPAIDVSNIDWRRQASSQQMRRAYPRSALRRQQDGRVVLRCMARADGRLADCDVVTPDARNADFSAAALRVVEHYQMRTVLRDASNVEGRSVLVPIVFRYSTDPDRGR